MSERKKREEHRKQPTCRHCGKPARTGLASLGPFCSELCKLQDLSAWFNEGYRIPSGPAGSAPGQTEDLEH